MSLSDLPLGLDDIADEMAPFAMDDDVYIDTLNAGIADGTLVLGESEDEDDEEFNIDDIGHDDDDDDDDDFGM